MPLVALPVKHLLKIFLLVFTLILAAAALAAPQSAKPSTEPSAIKVDACALLTSAEVSEIQGSPMRRSVLSEPPGAAFHVAQCYFETATTSRSVSLLLASPDAHKPARPREFWNEKFHPIQKEAKAVKSAKAASANREEEEEERGKLREVEGLGDEAFWENNGVAGALYVLTEDRFLRISIGGADTDEARLEKAKKLAAHVLARIAGK